MMEEGVFPNEDIEVLFQDYKHRPYRQVGSPSSFIPYLSVLDALMNIGHEQTLEMIKTGTQTWLTWDTMMEHAHLQTAPSQEELLDN